MSTNLFHSGDIKRGDLITAEFANQILSRIEQLEEGNMNTRLHVTAISHDVLASPGDSDPLHILISVTNSNGEPKVGLTISNFTLSTLLVGPGGAYVEVDDFRPSQVMPGAYHVHVIPIGNNTWKSGLYVFGVAVEAGQYQGQTLVSVELGE